MPLKKTVAFLFAPSPDIVITLPMPKDECYIHSILNFAVSLKSLIEILVIFFNFRFFIFNCNLFTIGCFLLYASFLLVFNSKEG